MLNWMVNEIIKINGLNELDRANVVNQFGSYLVLTTGFKGIMLLYIYIEENLHPTS